MAAEVFSKLTPVLEGTGTAWEGRSDHVPSLNTLPQLGSGTSKFLQPASLAGTGPIPSSSRPLHFQGFLKKRPEQKGGPTFPGTQHHMVVLADSLVFTAQAVRIHVPIEPLRIVEDTLCQGNLG